MGWDRDDDTRQYKVVINHEEQYSIWPADRENPRGWKDVGKQGSKQECLDYIEEVWTDMRPLSARDRARKLAEMEKLIARAARGRPANQSDKQRGRSKGTPAMPLGTVKWFNATKGFGFIVPDEGGKDVFVHISAVERSGLQGLADDQAIEYELYHDERRNKTSAVDLKLI